MIKDGHSDSKMAAKFPECMLFDSNAALDTMQYRYLSTELVE